MPSVLKDLWTYLRRSIGRDPAADWPSAAAVSLVFDVTRRELNGVPLGGSYALLRWFGRPGNPRPFRECCFGFPRLGLEAYLGLDDKIHGFACIFTPGALSATEMEADPEFSPCSIELRLPADVRAQVGPGTTRADLARLLGEPEQDGEKEGLRTLIYPYPDVYLGFQFDREDRLRVLDLESGSPGDPD
ncbi:MAG TPA: hypothetical protein VHG28_11240 [Longimicrobiaceae bacterium]|nr:hypothetical protein [Longimicrobiaceae bacterium]